MTDYLEARKSALAIESCPRCEKGELHPVVDKHGVLLTTRIEVIPANSQNIGKWTMGGDYFIAGYKLCRDCGLIVTLNLTLLGLAAPKQPEVHAVAAITRPWARVWRRLTEREEA